MQTLIQARLIIIPLLMILASCANSSSRDESAPPTSDPSNEDLTPYSNQVIYAQKWSEIIIQANFAKTTITLGAHLITSRNACGRDAYGPIALNDWNDLAETANWAVESPMGDDYCMEEVQELDQNGYYKKHLDGSAQIKLENGQMRELFIAKEGSICTHLQNHDLAKRLLNQLNHQVIQADREDCPNGWGSN